MKEECNEQWKEKMKYEKKKRGRAYFLRRESILFAEGEHRMSRVNKWRSIPLGSLQFEEGAYNLRREHKMGCINLTVGEMTVGERKIKG